MGFASSSKISLLPLFAGIPRTFPFVVEIALHYPGVSIAPLAPPCHESRGGKSGPAANLTMSLAQNRKTVPVEGCAVSTRSPVRILI